MGNGYRALRKGRVSNAGQVYFLTFTTAGRRPLFVSWSLAADAARAMTQSSAWRDSTLLAWVLMPDHWHGLVRLGDGARLKDCMQRLKGASARYLRARHARLGKVWARGFHDHALRREEDMLAVARYLVLNPVRAGLVRSVGSYPFWDAAWLSGRPRTAGAAPDASSCRLPAVQKDRG